jgi:dihydroorotate dehydrogenase
MSIIKYENLKKIIFKLDPETAHTVAGVGLKAINYCPPLFNYLVKRNFVNNDILTQNLFGQTFYNPVGLAAGFDKDAEYIKATAALGFGFSEVGTVTPKPQSGNQKPRLFRLIEDESIQNAMGFNNKGSYNMLKNLKKNRFFCYPLGINIGKNKTTPEIEALKDYENLFKTFKNYGTYIVINISSPNTPGLRNLQNESFIKEVFKIGTSITNKPILLKIAPDLEAKEAIDICKIAVNAGASGIIATNTTIDYSLTPNAKDFGGISGKLLKEKSFNLFKEIAKELFGQTVLISVGGIDSANEAYKRIKAGASLVQIYSALIFKGPSLIRDINQELIKLIKKDGFNSINEAIGADLK